MLRPGPVGCHRGTELTAAVAAGLVFSLHAVGPFLAATWVEGSGWGTALGMKAKLSCYLEERTHREQRYKAHATVTRMCPCRHSPGCSGLRTLSAWVPGFVSFSLKILETVSEHVCF